LKFFGSFGFPLSAELENFFITRDFRSGDQFQFNLVNEEEDERFAVEVVDGECVTLTLSISLPFLGNDVWAEAILPAVTSVVTMEDLPTRFETAERTFGTHTVFEPRPYLEIQVLNRQDDPIVHNHRDENFLVLAYKVCSERNSYGSLRELLFVSDALPAAFPYVLRWELFLWDITGEGFSIENPDELGRGGQAHLVNVERANGEARDLSYGRCLRVRAYFPAVPRLGEDFMEEVQFSLTGINTGAIENAEDLRVEAGYQDGWREFQEPLPWNLIQFIPPPEGVYLELHSWGDFGFGRASHFIWSGNLAQCEDVGPDDEHFWGCPLQYINGEVKGDLDPEDLYQFNAVTYALRYDRPPLDQEPLALQVEIELSGQVVAIHRLDLDPAAGEESHELRVGNVLSRENRFRFNIRVYVLNEDLPERDPRAVNPPRLQLELLEVDLHPLDNEEFPLSTIIDAPDQPGSGGWAPRPLDEANWPLYHFGPPELQLVSVEQVPPEGEEGEISLSVCQECQAGEREGEECLPCQETTLMQAEFRTPQGAVDVCEWSFRHGTGKFRAPAADLALRINGILVSNFIWDQNFVTFRAAEAEACAHLRAGSRHRLEVTMGQPLGITDPGEPIQLRLVGIEAHASEDGAYGVNLQVGTNEQGMRIWLGEVDSVRSFAVEIRA
jgi:hypothetical protein